jgi:hypothetical protein
MLQRGIDISLKVSHAHTRFYLIKRGRSDAKTPIQQGIQGQLCWFD